VRGGGVVGRPDVPQWSARLEDAGAECRHAVPGRPPQTAAGSYVQGVRVE